MKTKMNQKIASVVMSLAMLTGFQLVAIAADDAGQASGALTHPGWEFGKDRGAHGGCDPARRAAVGN